MAETSSKVGLPFRLLNREHYPNTQEKPAALDTAGVKIDDGRKNGQTSPVETWKPSLNRTQSWNQEDLKRERTLKDLQEKEKNAAAGTEKGFSEAKK
ncbi:hypothetical protein PVAG01_01025 [Phlyctema vagabunda]|uniref:Uncharacterized protein n=1 Tax=Phlyctema vagabunda TaxID=108571 RepID=A0ABR4PVY6_9HELO